MLVEQEGIEGQKTKVRWCDEALSKRRAMFCILFVAQVQASCILVPGLCTVFLLACSLWGRFRTARAQRVHSARTAPVITVFTPVTALKTCHL